MGIYPFHGNQHRRDLELLERVQGRHQGDQRDGAALDQRDGAADGGKAGRAGIVQPGGEKLWGDPAVAFQCLKELTRKVERDLGQGIWSARTQGVASQCQRAGMDGYWEGIVPWEGGQALAQGAQSSCGCPWIPGSAQGQKKKEKKERGERRDFSKKRREKREEEERKKRREKREEEKKEEREEKRRERKKRREEKEKRKREEEKRREEKRREEKRREEKREEKRREEKRREEKKRKKKKR
ncbi:hypothetical protein DUI87_11920 [Hirundo rustica rustica]|uniref:Uncharacterized protein n=1 Tax=Hirundo rustica rustica TaxID=333673 RepID=A0A3M0KKP1_HIRRU|nr:hypothetical protein DUI87_11920 [Hirundo rustica rustica]